MADEWQVNYVIGFVVAVYLMGAAVVWSSLQQLRNDPDLHRSPATTMTIIAVISVFWLPVTIGCSIANLIMH